MCCHDMKMLRDRDTVLSQVRTKFEKLRNDFQHNLVLLEARDAEIRRLERALQELQASYAEQAQAASGVAERLKAAELKLHAADHDRIERESFWKVVGVCMCGDLCCACFARPPSHINLCMLLRHRRKRCGSSGRSWRT